MAVGVTTVKTMCAWLTLLPVSPTMIVAMDSTATIWRMETTAQILAKKVCKTKKVRLLTGVAQLFNLYEGIASVDKNSRALET